MSHPETSGRAFERPAARPVSVSELNRRAREALEGHLPLLWVSGEISNLTRAVSGHLYFTLKDEQAQVRCVMFRSRAQLLGWRPENGQKIEAQVRVTLYEPRGDYQLNVEAVRLAGKGNLYEEFQRLKERLDREGLFDAAGKRPLPAFPRRIGIVTSPQAAALRDVVTTLGRRAPQVALILYPTPVQGGSAAVEIVKALETASRRAECDLLILCRGGGSIEDLWCFNDEGLARALRRCPLPVVCGVGHETDFTIADFAADLRAPTPTAAAELAAPVRDELAAQLAALQARIQGSAMRRLRYAQQQLDSLGRCLRHPAERLRQHDKELASLALRRRAAGERLLAAKATRLGSAGLRLERCTPGLAPLRARLGWLADALAGDVRLLMKQRRSALDALAAHLRHLDPHAVLERGYSLVLDDAGQIVKNASDMEPGARITVNLSRGSLDATVERIRTPEAGASEHC